MCGNLFGSKKTQAAVAPAPDPAAPPPPGKQVYSTGANVLNTDVVAATGSGDPTGSGRIKLGKSARRGSGAAVGLTI